MRSRAHRASRIAVFASAITAFYYPSGAHALADSIDFTDAKSTVEMNYCADRDYQAADRALNAAYRDAIAQIKSRNLEKPYDSESFETAMRVAQRAWLAYRDADCKDLTAQEWSGGSGTSSAVMGCMTEMTIARTKELKDRYGTR